jgi:RND family efflux transporter MFP subunit
MHRLLPILLALLFLAATTACDRQDVAAAPEAPKPPAARPAPRATSPAAAPASRRAGWIGVLVARQMVDVTADSQGRLQAMHVSIGDRLRRGDLIATLDMSLAAQDLEMARSNQRAAEADERRAADEFAEAKARNDRRQSNPDFFSKEDLAEAALRAKTAASALEMARSRTAEQRARLRQIETSLSRNQIRAPFDGQVAERFADAGAIVGPGTPLVRLISAGDLLVRAAVPPEEARKLSLGTPVIATVRTLGLRIPGTIERIAPEVDAASQMVLIEVRLAPTPEMSARIQTGLVVDVTPRNAPA